jgi:putative FmdB family regulatory protein
MPTYDYRCSRCGYSFEKSQKMSDEKLTVCPKCSGQLKRLIGKGAFISFKGSGFYCTDYKGSGR